MDKETNVNKRVGIKIHQFKSIEVEESMEKRATRKTKTAVEHPTEDGLTAVGNKRNVVSGGSMPFEVRLMRKDTLNDHGLDLGFGGVAGDELAEALGNFDALENGSTGGGHCKSKWI